MPPASDMSLRALSRAARVACSGGAAISRAAVNPAAPPLQFKDAALWASTRAARTRPGKSDVPTAGISPGEAAIAGPVKADQIRVFGLSWFAETRAKAPSLTSHGRKICTSTVAACRLPAPQVGSRGTASTTKPSSVRFMSTWTTKPSSMRLMSTRAKFSAAGGPLVYCFLVIIALGGGIAIYLSKSKKDVDNFHDEELPASVDWSLLPGFPPVVDPSYNFNDFCGSCWVVIAVKSIESAYAIENGESLNLSIQQVIDCAAYEGCCGNTLVCAYSYISKTGLTTEESYPGPPARGRSFWHGLLLGYCKMEGKQIVAKIEGFQRIDPTELALMRALQTSPVAVYVNYNKDFVDYEDGIIELGKLPPCSVQPGTKHVMLVVGYGTDSDGRKYWKLMNTWGPSWGEDGYCKFRRGCGHAHGVGGITEHPGFRPIICKVGQ